MNNKKNLTIKEFSEIIQQDYLATTALVKLMVTVGFAKEVGSNKVEGQRGKPSKIYEIESSMEVEFWQNEEDETAVDNQADCDNIVTETSEVTA
jgi:hypothetical protein